MKKRSNYEIHHWGSNMPRIKSKNMRRREYMFRHAFGMFIFTMITLCVIALLVATFAERGAE